MLERSLRNIAHGLLLVAAMLALIAAGLWFRGADLEPEAVARGKPISTKDTGIPDSGRQRQMIVTELKAVNGRLKAIESALRDGEYTIQTKPLADDGAAAGGNP
ncbi:MAG: hypothetical protein R6X20_19285 [Phycisphaerae bacterium]